jgi:membrane-associated phospholipid phosphatase
VKIETFPLIAGGLVALLGLALILDAWMADFTLVRRERRRRPRRIRNRTGEFFIGLGMLGMAGALIGRDEWRYRILATLVGAFFLLLGIAKNGAYLREVLVNRGAKRRADPPIGTATSVSPAADAVKQETPRSP